MPPQNSEESNWFVENLLPHEAMLRAWLESRFPPSCDIDDIIQDAYVRVLDARKKGKLRSPKAFLFATSRNLAIDRLRHLKVAKNESLVENDLSDVWDENMGIPETVARNQELEISSQTIIVGLKQVGFPQICYDFQP